MPRWSPCVSASAYWSSAKSIISFLRWNSRTAWAVDARPTRSAPRSSLPTTLGVLGAFGPGLDAVGRSAAAVPSSGLGSALGVVIVTLGFASARARFVFVMRMPSLAMASA